MTDKKNLRLLFKQKRKEIACKREKSIKIAEKFFITDVYKNADTIMLFYPLNDEVNTLFIFEKALKDGKKVVFPVTDIKSKEIIPVYYKNGFKKGAYGIFEPTGGLTADKNQIDAVIIPALSADTKNYRLGYGGGCYDRFLKDFKGYKATVLFSELLTDSLPHDNFDIKTDEVITD